MIIYCRDLSYDPDRGGEGGAHVASGSLSLLTRGRKPFPPLSAPGFPRSKTPLALPTAPSLPLKGESRRNGPLGWSGSVAPGESGGRISARSPLGGLVSFAVAA